MCNFKPGEVTAFGRLHEMIKRTRKWSIPGETDYVPLLPEGLEPVVPPDYSGQGFLHVKHVPEGLELLTVSKLSAALADMIRDHQAVVEPNYILPFGGPAANAPAPFSPAMQTVIDAFKPMIAARSNPYRMAVLDSGLSADQLQNFTNLRCFDYMGAQPVEVPDSVVTDRQNHGSLVCRIISAVMDGEAELVFGRVAIGRSDVTVLSLSKAHAHMVAETRPDVINLSVAPSGDSVFCPDCNRVVPVGHLHSMILPRIFELAGQTTWTVLAAGNTGKPSVGQHELSVCDRMVIASAVGSDNVRTAYSSYATHPDIANLSCFGGDDRTVPGRQGVLGSGPHVCGTSFSAPLISCALASSIEWNSGTMRTSANTFESDVVTHAQNSIAQVHAAL